MATMATSLPSSDHIATPEQIKDVYRKKMLAVRASGNASNALVGFVYQVARAVLRWTSIGPDNYIFLEAGDDFDVVTTLGAMVDAGKVVYNIDLTQVKHVKENATLREDNTLKSILHAAQMLSSKKLPTGSKLQFIIATTQKAGVEKKAAGYPPIPQKGYIHAWAQKTKDFSVSDLQHFLVKALSETKVKELDSTIPYSEIIGILNTKESFQILVDSIRWELECDSLNTTMTQIAENLQSLHIGLRANDGLSSVLAQKLLVEGYTVIAENTSNGTDALLKRCLSHTMLQTHISEFMKVIMTTVDINTILSEKEKRLLDVLKNIPTKVQDMLNNGFIAATEIAIQAMQDIISRDDFEDSVRADLLAGITGQLLKARVRPLPLPLAKSSVKPAVEVSSAQPGPRSEITTKCPACGHADISSIPPEPTSPTMASASGRAKKKTRVVSSS
jgi:hypothetical protein